MGCAWMISGCDSMIQEVPAPEEEPTIALSCELVNGSGGVDVYLTKTKPVFGPVDFGPYETIDNANVTLSGPGQSVNLVSQGNGVYQANISTDFIAPLNSYTITASTPDGKSVTATNQTPSGTKPVVEVTVDSVVFGGFFFEKSYLFLIDIHDVVGESNWYEVEGFYVFEDGSNRGINFASRYALISDEGRDGEKLRFQGSSTYGDGEHRPVKSVELIVRQLDEASYLFFKSLNTGIDQFGEDVPFTEPTIIPTNVEGGMGHFGGNSRFVYQFNF
jgi:hypothetical protein